jgi:TRAP-type C4-dicarboxylate transport system substrate-binding protein
MKNAISWQRQRAAEEDEKARETLIQRGMKFDPISAELRTELRKRTEPVVTELKRRIGDEVVDAVLKETAQ